MEVLISTRKFIARRALRNFITESLSTTLARFVSYIDVVRVEMSDRNGRRGGGDKCCRILLQLKVGEPVLVQDIEANPKRAILNAASRAQAALRNQLRSL